jgi:hypothetical protein
MAQATATTISRKAAKNAKKQKFFFAAFASWRDNLLFSQLFTVAAQIRAGRVGIQHVMRAGVILTVAEEDQGPPAARGSAEHQVGGW